MSWEICITPEGWNDIYEALHNPERFTSEQLRAALADDDYEAWEQSQSNGEEEKASNRFVEDFFWYSEFEGVPEESIKRAEQSAFDTVEMLFRVSEPNYETLKDSYANLAHDTLADLAFERIEQHNTCDNGGSAYWIDRQGYHTVNID